jgi:hypothetical protein
MLMKVINITALCLSVIALTVALWTYQQADARAEQALQRREKALVERYKLDVFRICEGLRLKDCPKDPQTLDELFRPLGGLLTPLSK